MTLRPNVPLVAVAALIAITTIVAHAEDWPHWRGPGLCLLTSDDRLIALTDEGTLLLMETAKRSPREAKVLFRRDRLFQSDVWPHVVLAGGRLLVKDRAGNLKCFTAQ